MNLLFPSLIIPSLLPQIPSLYPLDNHIIMFYPHVTGDTDGALAIYKRAVENFPENSELLSVLGLLYLQMGDTQKAFEHLGRFLSTDLPKPVDPLTEIID